MIQSFNQIRLTNQIINASGGQLSVGGQTVVYSSQTGAFYPASNPSGYIGSSSLAGYVTTGQTGAFITTGQTGSFYPASNPSGFITGESLFISSSGNFVTNSQTGNFLAASTFSTFTGNAQNFVTTINTGVSSQFIAFPFNFGSVPKVVVTMEVTGAFVYGMGISSRTISGYTALFSDIIGESGVSLHTHATVNN